MKAYILIGMIGSGKSAWARMMAGTDFNIIRIGVDDIRNMIKDRYTFDFQLEPLIDEMKMAMIRKVLNAGKDVIIDDSHLTKEVRKDLCMNLVEMTRTGIDIIYVRMMCDDDLALKRRLSNLRGKSEFEWRQAMYEDKSMFEVPDESENEYHFSIIEVNNE